MRLLILLCLVAVTGIIASLQASAFSGFPAGNYPSNQYGYNARYYNGPWGERMVYGGYGYFPNFNGQLPYGYRSYGNMYTPYDLMYGNTGGYRSYGNNGFVTYPRRAYG